MVLAAKGFITPSDILNHAASNLSDPDDCPGCPTYAFDRLALSPDNWGTMAICELNPANDLQLLGHSWYWYWPTTTNPVRLWPQWSQDCTTEAQDCVAEFTPGYVLVRSAAWHQAPATAYRWPDRWSCTTDTAAAAFIVDPDYPELIAPPLKPPDPPAPTPTALPTEWKYWACAGDAAGEWAFEWSSSWVCPSHS